MQTTYYKKPEILKTPQLLDKHLVIEASAGTGKTYTLEHLVLELLINSPADAEVNIEDILIVTFTEAATRELRERVRSLIRKILDSGSPLPLAADPDVYWAIDESTRVRLREALFRFDGAAISTIHGFCQRILAEQAFLSGRLFELEHADGAEMFGLAFREEIRIAIAENSAVGKMLQEWLAGGESIKKLEEFLYNCHREGSPQRCPVTPAWDPEVFLEALDSIPPRAALERAGDDYYSGQAKKSYSGTLNELFAAIEKISATDKESERGAIFQDWANKIRTINKIKETQLNHLLRAAAEGAPAEIKELVGKLLEAEVRTGGSESFFIYYLLGRVNTRLAARKNALGLIDFDDLLLGVLKALKGPGADALLAALRKRWRYALVDEFQDTDPVQWEIFRRIFVDGQGKQRLLVIGDPKQAIYGFRGADVYTYDEAKKYLLDEMNALKLPLTENFRSTAAIIGAVNEILTISDAEGNSFFDGLNRYEYPVKCGNPTLTATNREGAPQPPVYLIKLYGEEEQLNAPAIARGLACFIAEEITSLTGPEGTLLTGSAEESPSPLKHSDIYILTRTANEGRKIGETLKHYGIPHAFYKQEGLFQTAEAESIYTLLLAISNPYDSGLRMAAWLTSFFDLPLEELIKWREVGENHPLSSQLLKWHQLAEQQAWARLFNEILSSSGLMKRLVFKRAERELTNYLHLFELLLAETHSRSLLVSDLTRFLKNRIDGRLSNAGKEDDLQRLESEREAVQILTMHKAKGLEAEVVFIGGGFGGFFNNQGVKTSIYHHNNRRYLHIGKASGVIAAAIAREEREESQRLLYVAMTRAKSRLYLPCFSSGKSDQESQKIYGYNRLGTAYQNLQKQLDLLDEKKRLQDSASYMIRETSCAVRPPKQIVLTPEAAKWPPEGLLELPLSSREETETIKERNRGVLLTSYSRIKAGENRQRSTSDQIFSEKLAADEQASDPASAMESRSEEEKLPAGKETGIFLHALLEDTPMIEVIENTEKTWLTLPQVQRRALFTARRYAYQASLLPQALKIVYAALRRPLKVESIEGTALLSMPEGIAGGKHPCPEMAFIYPIPEHSHNLLGGQQQKSPAQFDRPPFQVERGFLQGLIDLVFEHEERFYLLDWKSDRLADYSLDSVNQHVENYYSLQARIYSLALIRLLKIADESSFEKQFGGVIYLFLRSFGEEPRQENANVQMSGIWFSRPAFTELLTWENELLLRNYLDF